MRSGRRTKSTVGGLHQSLINSNSPLMPRFECRRFHVHNLLCAARSTSATAPAPDTAFIRSHTGLTRRYLQTSHRPSFSKHILVAIVAGHISAIKACSALHRFFPFSARQNQARISSQSRVSNTPPCLSLHLQLSPSTLIAQLTLLTLIPSRVRSLSFLNCAQWTLLLCVISLPLSLEHVHEPTTLSFSLENATHEAF